MKRIERKIEHAKQVECRIRLVSSRAPGVATEHPRPLNRGSAKWITPIHCETVPICDGKAEMLRERLSKDNLTRVIVAISEHVLRVFALILNRGEGAKNRFDN